MTHYKDQFEPAAPMFSVINVVDEMEQHMIDTNIVNCYQDAIEYEFVSACEVCDILARMKHGKR